MAVDSLGSKRQPHFLDGGSPDIAVDDTAVADYAAYVGNRIIGTTAERIAASSWAWKGLQWLDTTDGGEYVWSGTAWTHGGVSPWVIYPANPTGFAVGTGGSAAVTEYRHEGDLIRVRYKFVFGTSGAVFPNTPKMNLPAASAAAAHPYAFINGIGDVFDTSVNRPIQSWVLFDNSSSTTVRIAMRISTGDGFDYPTPTTPFTWAAGDVMQGEFTYRPA